ncbi:MAG: S8 family serine peptidase [Candidatus Kerfeldbacteria bacterium]|nr:S8 family serine peptidase [Candidatus Kerfeldbacteria bacterium]
MKTKTELEVSTPLLTRTRVLVALCFLGAVAAFGLALTTKLKSRQSRPLPQRVTVATTVTADDQSVTRTSSVSDQPVRPAVAAGQVLVKFKSIQTADELLAKRKSRSTARIEISGAPVVTEALERFRVTKADRGIAHSTDGETSTLVTLTAENLSAEDTWRLAENLKADAAVAYAEPNLIFHTTPASEVEGESGGDSGGDNPSPNDPYFSSSGSWGNTYSDQWGMLTIDAPNGWRQVADNLPVVVAVIDTGMDFTHPDFSAAWQNPRESGPQAANGVDDDRNGYIDDWRGWDFVTYDDGVADNDPTDDFGHGTHVAGIIAATWNNGVGIAGLGKEKLRIMSLKALDDQGVGSLSDLASAIYYAADNGAKVINASWGAGPMNQSPTLLDAVNYAHNLWNVVFIASAGNSNADVGTETSGYTPANIRNAVTVGAVGPNSARASFSNFGLKIDVMAPGVDVLSLRATGTDMYCTADSRYCTPTTTHIVGGHPGGEYYRSDGTSMAAPHVTALAALFLGKYPDRTPEHVRQALRHGTIDAGSVGRDNYYGFGLIKAAKIFDEWDAPALQITGPTDTQPGMPTTVTAVLTGDQIAEWRMTAPAPDGTTGTLASGGAAPTEPISAPWDLTPNFEGSWPVTLWAKNNRGYEYSDVFLVRVDRLFITSPASGAYLGNLGTVEVRGTANPRGFTSYSLRVTRERNGATVTPPITYPSGGQQPVIRGLLATIDLSGLDPDYYRVYVDSNGSDGRSTESIQIVVDRTLHAGWPQSIGPIIAPDLRLSLYSHFDTANIDGSGGNEIISGYGEYIRVFHHTGQTLWERSVDDPDHGGTQSTQYGPAVGDVTGDGLPEVVAVNNKGRVFVWDRTGAPLPGWPAQLSTAKPNRVSLGDLNGDGVNEMIFSSWDGYIRAYNANNPATPQWEQFIWPAQEIGDVSIGDIDGNSANGQELAFLKFAYVGGFDISTLYVYNSAGQQLCRRDGLSADPNMAALVLADLDQNGDLEIIETGLNGWIHVWNHDCATELPGWPKSIGLQLHTPAVADLDGNGQLDIVAGTQYDGHPTEFRYISYLYAWRASGTLLPGWPVMTSGNMTGSIGVDSMTIADVDGVAGLEVITFGDSQNGIPTAGPIAFRADGTEVSGFRQPTFGHPAGEQVLTPVIADLDGDGLLEVATVDTLMNLYVWDLTASVTAAQPWPMFQRDPLHSGRYR